MFVLEMCFVCVFGFRFAAAAARAAIVISSLVILTHKKNIERLLNKQESKMPLNLKFKNKP